MMEVIPAIDLRGGRCVRLFQGDFARQTTYDGDPVEYARRWEHEGAGRLHVVDLDGAAEGSPNPVHLEIIRRMCSAIGIPLEVGGGIRTRQSVQAVLGAGVERVVLGTALIRQPDLASALITEFGERVVAGIDARDGVVAVDAWVTSSATGAIDLATHLVQAGCRRFVFTDIGRDGMQAGPNLDALTAFARSVDAAVIASGGVGNRSDVALLAASSPPNVEAVIVGRALYDGSVTLGDAIEAGRHADVGGCHA